MQERLVNKLKRTAKRIAAVAVSAGMVGATVSGAAFAADLSGLPSPFVSNGVFDAMVVVGADAATIDVAGAIEVATAFGQLATTTTATTGTADLNLISWGGPDGTTAIATITTARVLGSALPSTALSVGAKTSYDILGNVSYTISNTEYWGVQNMTVGQWNITDDLTLKIPKGQIDYYFSVLNKSSASSTDVTNYVDLSLNTTKLNVFGTLYGVVGYAPSGNVTLGTVESVKSIGVNEDVKIGSHTVKVTKAYDDSTGDSADFEIDGVAVSDISTSSTDPTKNGVTIDASTISVKKSTEGAAVVSFDVRTSDMVLQNDKAFSLDTSYYVDTDNKYALRIHNKNVELSAGNTKNAYVSGPGKVTNITVSDLQGSGGAERFLINESIMTSYWLVVNQTGGVNFNTSVIPGQTYLNLSAMSSDATVYSAWSFGDQRLSDTSIDKQSFLKISEPSSQYFLLNISGNGTEDEVLIQNIVYHNSSGNFNLVSGTEYALDSGINLTYTKRPVSGTGAADQAYNDTVLFEVSGLSIVANETETPGGSAPQTFSIRYGVSGVYSGANAKTNRTDSGIKMTYGGGTSLTFTESDGNEITVTLYKNDTSGDVTFNGITDTKGATTFGTSIDYINITDEKTLGVSVSAGKLNLTTPLKQVKYGIGTWVYSTKSLKTGTEDKIGNSTVSLKSAGGSSVSVNKVAAGFADLDTSIVTSTLSVPIVLAGGSSVNDLVKTLIDGNKMSSTAIIAAGDGHAQIDFVENAFGTNTALVIAGYTGQDTLKACRAVTASLLNKAPIDFSAQSGKVSLLLNTGVTVYSDVSIVTTTA